MPPVPSVRRLVITPPVPRLLLGPPSLDRPKTRFPDIMIARQARFLEFLYEHARRYPYFSLTFHASGQELIEEDGAVKGMRYKDETGAVHEVRAPLTVAADGRASQIGSLAGFEPERQSSEIDVIWLRLPKKDGDAADEGALYIGDGRFMVVFERESEWQAGYVIAKGGYLQLREVGIAHLQQNVARLVPWLADRMGALDDWKKTHVLTVKADHLPLWHKPGLLFIGDAALSMSPVGGVSINYAIGNAVERPQTSSRKSCARAGRTIQRVQSVIQERIVGETLRHKAQFVPPWPLRFLLRTRYLRDIPARMVAVGPRPYRLERADEHAPRSISPPHSRPSGRPATRELRRALSRNGSVILARAFSGHRNEAPFRASSANQKGKHA